MKTKLNVFLSLLALFTYFNSNAQDDDEWLVEINPDDGTFEAFGPALYDYVTFFTGFQCKDETNGQFIFITAENPSLYVSVDINTSEIVDETPNPFGFFPNAWGYHCYGNCDTLVMYCRDDPMNRYYVGLFDRFNGTEVIQIGDSIPNDNSTVWDAAFNNSTFDPNNNILYVYNQFSSILRLIDIPSGELVQSHNISSSNLKFITFDEVNGKLYGLESIDLTGKRLLIFDTISNDFIPVGDIFTSITDVNSYYTSPPTIDGNNQRMFVTSLVSGQGSFMMSIGLNTGQLLTDVQTVIDTTGGGLLGGRNVIGAEYFNSTNQLIALHWGEGQSDSPTNVPKILSQKSQLSPNPNQGEFKIQFDGQSNERLTLRIVNHRGQIVFEKGNYRNDERLELSLSSGYYIANLQRFDGGAVERIPFVVTTH